MQQELDAAGLSRPVKILMVNEAGYESGQSDMAEEGDLPLLQDTYEQATWVEWGIRYRDVVILDADGEYVGEFNLTDNSLSDEDNYTHLNDLFVSAIDP